MSAAITVPRRGWSMEEGTFAGWLKKDGDRVARGEPLFVLESDKAGEEIEAIDPGILRIPADGPQPGDKVQVGQIIGYLVGEGEAIADARATGVSPVPSRPTGEPPVSAVPQNTGGTPVARRRRVPITPRARRVAAELGIDLAALHGTGRNGRIRERDVRSATPSGGRLVPHTTLRRTIAARMVAGVTEAAPVTLTTKLDATNLVNLREQFKVSGTPAESIPSYTDLVVKLAAVALRAHPLLQAQWREEGLFVPDRVDVAVAVDTPDGLLVPVVRQADRLSLLEITAALRFLAGKAREGRLTAGEMRDATFTVTNLGGLGVDAFTPVIHLPQCAVLGVGRVVREPAIVGEQVVPRDMMTLSLTFDHRVLDGAPAARFLDTLRRCLEQPVPHLLPSSGGPP